ncbi:MAG: 2TM domain-containing protein, partial [Spirochaetales bacterium]|nr:2TM domain-containing protein [Spirochaetales bacterium]
MTYNEYKEILFNEYVKKGDHFRNHLVSFLAVNIGIFLLNMLTSPGFPWFLFVVGGWGIG